MAKHRSTSASESRSKSLKPTKKSSAINGKRRHSTSPAPAIKKSSSKQALKIKTKGKKLSRTPSVSPVRTPIKGRANKKVEPAPEKKRKGNTGKATTVVIVSDDEDNATPRKKKASKVEQKAVASRAANVTPTKGRGRSVTPVKLPAKKKVVAQLPLPEDVADAVTQVILDNKGSKLAAPKILQLIQEQYIGATEVLVYTAIGNLFRAGLLNETKGAFAVDQDVLEQLKPPAPVIVPVAVEEEEEAPAAVVAEEEPAVAAEQNPEAMEVEEPAAVATTGSLRKSAAKEEAASVRRSVAKEEASTVSAKKSVAREASETSARKSTQKSAAKGSVKKVSEDFVDNVIASETAPAADALPTIAEEQN